MYSLYSPDYVTKTSANGNAVYWSRDTRISAYTPFHFSFTVPLSTQNLINSYEGLIRSKVPWIQLMYVNKYPNITIVK